jgi:2-keto-4-pentenoate hydratase/2-oxohepta-3-ene-1,7-dioic acid hydratase in catechol pathway
LLVPEEYQYQHKDLSGQKISLPVGKVVCVGRNYLMHIKELNNEVPDAPLLFIKPSTSLIYLSKNIDIPQGQGECHNELELAVLMAKPLKGASQNEVADAIWGYGLALDLTLRDVQAQLKKQGHPWERAKGFDGSCPVSPFVEKSAIDNHDNLNFELKVNGQQRQLGNSGDMIFSINALLSEISQTFTLLPGDIVLTGTPQGVAALRQNDILDISFQHFFQLSTKVN